MKAPLISIVVPCYNQAVFLNEALDSILNQTYNNWECIIVNDGSPDQTKEVVKHWLKKDDRFKYFFQCNKGVSSARNTGILESKGEFILPLDADDKISSEYVELAMEEFRAFPDLKLVYCEAEIFGDACGNWHLEPFNLKKIVSSNMIFSSAVYRKTDWERIGGYDEKMISGLEDWEFWISLLKDGGEVTKMNHTGFFYRVKNESRNKGISNNQKKELYEYISVKHADFFVKQLGSFHALISNIHRLENNYAQKLKSEKFVLNLFFKRFFGVTIWKSIKF